MSVKNVVDKISERQAKLESLKKLLLDPDLADFARALSENGDKRGTGPSSRLKQRPGNRSTPNANGIRAAILGLSLPSQFTPAQVLEGLKKRGFKFDREPIGAVRDSLYVMAKKARGIRLVRKFDSEHPNLYERTKP